MSNASTAIYPWSDWLHLCSKRSMTFVRGKDYDCMTHSFAQQVRNAAYRNRYQVSILISGNHISVESRKENA